MIHSLGDSFSRLFWLQGVAIHCIPPPQNNLKVAQYNKTYCQKVKSFSAMDFQYFLFCTVLIFTTFLMLSNENAQFKKMHKEALKTYRLLVTFCIDIVQSHNGNKSQIHYNSFAILLWMIWHWSGNGILVKRNKLMNKFLTFDPFEWPANNLIFLGIYVCYALLGLK